MSNRNKQNKSGGIDPFTIVGIACFLIFGAMGLMGLGDENPNYLLVMFNIAIAMVALFLALWPIIKSNRK